MLSATRVYVAQGDDVLDVSLYGASAWLAAKVTVHAESADALQQALAAGHVKISVVGQSLTAYASVSDVLASTSTEESKSFSTAMLGIVVGVVALAVLVIVVIVVVVLRRRRRQATAHITPGKTAASTRTTSYNNPMYASGAAMGGPVAVVVDRNGGEEEDGAYAELGAGVEGDYLEPSVNDHGDGDDDAGYMDVGVHD